jgi:hypothetical protein
MQAARYSAHSRLCAASCSDRSPHLCSHHCGEPRSARVTADCARCSARARPGSSKNVRIVSRISSPRPSAKSRPGSRYGPNAAELMSCADHLRASRTPSAAPVSAVPPIAAVSDGLFALHPARATRVAALRPHRSLSISFAASRGRHTAKYSTSPVCVRILSLRRHAASRIPMPRGARSASLTCARSISQSRPPLAWLSATGTNLMRRFVTVTRPPYARPS